eukprot:scaffold299119_cov32-Tisochrysis_lutea.AAC.4
MDRLKNRFPQLLRGGVDSKEGVPLRVEMMQGKVRRQPLAAPVLLLMLHFVPSHVGLAAMARGFNCRRHAGPNPHIPPLRVLSRRRQRLPRRICPPLPVRIESWSGTPRATASSMRPLQNPEFLMTCWREGEPQARSIHNPSEPTSCAEVA